jgi:hypothetical protein
VTRSGYKITDHMGELLIGVRWLRPPFAGALIAGLTVFRAAVRDVRGPGDWVYSVRVTTPAFSLSSDPRRVEDDLVCSIAGG